MTIFSNTEFGPLIDLLSQQDEKTWADSETYATAILKGDADATAVAAGVLLKTNQQTAISVLMELSRFVDGHDTARVQELLDAAKLARGAYARGLGQTSAPAQAAAPAVQPAAAPASDTSGANGAAAPAASTPKAQQAPAAPSAPSGTPTTGAEQAAAAAKDKGKTTAK